MRAYSRLRATEMKRAWTDEGRYQTEKLAQKYPTAEIVERLGRSVSVTTIRAGQLRVSLRMPERKKQGSTDAAPAGTDVRWLPAERAGGFCDVSHERTASTWAKNEAVQLAMMSAESRRTARLEP
jgi:hypothetical protein